MRQAIAAAAEAIARADALWIGAGAGMGVDSGLPSFRGREGFWREYPPFARRGLSFAQVANPRWFEADPELAWGFYGHRLGLYRAGVPHAGFGLLQQWAARMRHGAFVFTSNIDGHFQRAGFAEERVFECHGSLGHLQCTQPCSARLWPVSDLRLDVDSQSFRARPPLPACPDCGAMARPNVLMFTDDYWVSERSDAQEAAQLAWLAGLDGARLVLIECGAGTAVPTVRWTSEGVARRWGGRLIRINPRDAAGPADAIAIEAGALEALCALAEALGPDAPRRGVDELERDARPR
ncbi:MAG: NAD-dependent deacetylase [Proteobacteria bacterium]|nr:NAD-dependent deacetylase [Pseudomonadota bacterium]